MIVLDGNKMTTKTELHHEISFAFNFPNYYGKNLDALWDCLTEYVSLPESVVWKNFTHSQNYLGDYADKVFSVFEDVSQELNGFSIRKVK